MFLLFIVFWKTKNSLYEEKNRKILWIFWNWFNDCIDAEIFKLFFLTWWNHINIRFQFEKIKRYFVSNRFWDEQKLFFSLWERFVNHVRIKIQCYKTRMLWTVKDIKESSFLIIRNVIYCWNRRQYSDYSI